MALLGGLIGKKPMRIICLVLGEVLQISAEVINVHAQV